MDQRYTEGQHQEVARAFSPRSPRSSEPVRERDFPRRARSRYPIPDVHFQDLKSRSKRELSPPKRAVIVDSSSLAPRRPLQAEAPETVPTCVAPPSVVSNFAGIGATDFEPPDCATAAAHGHVMVAVNATAAVYSSTGAVETAPVSLTTWFSNVIQNAKIFDPKLTFDQYADRWLLLTAALNDNPHGSWFLLSASDTNDPNGAWSNYALDMMESEAGADAWADYPCMGIDQRALYLTGNMFVFDGEFKYSKLRIIDKSLVYAGSALTFKDFTGLVNQDGSLAFTVQPCHVFGGTDTQFLVNSQFPSETQPTPQTLTVWSLADPLGSPALTGTSVMISQYAIPPHAEQPGGTLDSGDTRLLNATLRQGILWTGLTTQHSWNDPSGTTPSRAALHWVSIDPSGPTLIQEGVYGSSANDYFYPAVIPDKNSNLAVAFTRSSSTEFGSMYLTGRCQADPQGTLAGDVLVASGAATYPGSRWGDYFQICLDNRDESTFWCSSELAAASWTTQVAAISF